MSENFTVHFRANTAQFVRGVRAARDQLMGMASAAGRIATRGGLLAGGALIGAGFGANATLDKLNEFARLSTRIRVDPKVIQVLDRFAKIKGVETDQLVEAIEELQRTVGEGKFNLLEPLGLDEKTLKPLLDNPIRLLGEFIDRLNRLGLAQAIAVGGPIVGEDVTRSLIGLASGIDAEKAKILQQTSPSALRNRGASGELRQLEARMQRTGQLLESHRERIERLRSGWLNLTGVLESFALRVAEKALPNVTNLANQLERWVQSQGGVGALAQNLLDTMSSLATRAMEITGGLEGILETMREIAAFARQTAGGVAGAFNTAFSAGRDLGAQHRAALQSLATPQGRQQALDAVLRDIRDLFSGQDVLPNLYRAVEGIERNTRETSARAG